MVKAVNHQIILITLSLLAGILSGVFFMNVIQPVPFLIIAYSVFINRKETISLRQRNILYFCLFSLCFINAHTFYSLFYKDPDPQNAIAVMFIILFEVIYAEVMTWIASKKNLSIYLTYCAIFIAVLVYPLFFI